MGKIITAINCPKNLKENTCRIHEKIIKMNRLKILELMNIDVTHNGICFKRSEIIRESVQAYPDKIRIFELEAELQFMNKLTITFKDKNQYLIIHHPWGSNYYHWITEALPRIWLVKSILHKLILILPDFYRKLNFIQESIEPFHFKEIIYIPDGYNMKIRNAIIPQIKPICSNYDPIVVRELREFYISYALRKGITVPDIGDRIYIMRGNSPRRKIANEDAVVHLLEKYNFHSINGSLYSFYEKVLFSARIKYLISNGAGLANMHFMRKYSSVMELQKRITNNNDFHDIVNLNLASVLNLNYYNFICDPIDIQQDMYNADLNINLKKLEYAIKEMTSVRN